MDGPVELYLEREHAFRKKRPDLASGKKRIGCAVCGAGRRAKEHMGVPPSLNDGGSGMNRREFWQIKMAWSDVLSELVTGSALGALTAPLEAVHVEVQMGFPTYQDRDEGNLRWMLEKVLGDVFVSAAVIPADTFFPVRRYTMGNLDGVHSPGRSWLRLLVFQSAATRAPRGDQKRAADETHAQPALGE